MEQIYERALEISMSMRRDYTTNSKIDNHENFKHSAELISWFNHDSDRAYVALIGTKLARLSALLSDERIPNNESVEDTFIDLINYSALWMERRTQSKEKR